MEVNVENLTAEKDLFTAKFNTEDFKDYIDSAKAMLDSLKPSNSQAAE